MRVLSEVRKYFANAFIIAELGKCAKSRHDQNQIWVRMVQPALWLAIYGLAMSKLNAMSANIPARPDLSAVHDTGCPGPIRPLCRHLFRVINVVWERDLGLLNNITVHPGFPLLDYSG